MRRALILLVCAVSVTALTAAILYPDRTIQRVLFSHPLVHTDSASALFVGDVMLARDIERKMRTYGVAYPFAHSVDLFDEYDSVFINFEAAVPQLHEPTPDFTLRFSVPEAHVPILSEVGITHASLANNHTDDFGATGLSHTRTALTRAGVHPIGVPHLFDVATSISTQQLADDLVLSVVAVDATADTESVSKAVHYLNKNDTSDTLHLVYIHWGTEYELTHSDAQEAIASDLAAAGADVIVGHHPHVVQDIQYVGDTLVFYSLGNFIFDQYFSRDVQEGIALGLSDAHGKTVTFTIHPVRSDASPGAPQLRSGTDQRQFLRTLASRSDAQLTAAIERGRIYYHKPVE